MVLLIGVCAFLTAALLALAIGQGLSARRTRARERIALLASLDAPAQAERAQALLRMQNYSGVPFLQRLLQNMASAERLADELDRAAVPLRVGEFLAVSTLLGLALAVAAYRLLPAGPPALAGAAAALLVGLWLPRRALRWRLRRRRAQFEAALPEALDIISRSIRAGNGLLTAIDGLIEQMPGPIGDEFGRMRLEIAAGLGLEAALRELDRRVDSQDLHIVVTAFLIQREVGGNLTEILDNVATTMRGRMTLRREMRALTSQQRYGAYVIAAVPPGIVLLITLTNPQFIAPLYASTLGWVALGVAATLELVGVLTLRWIITSFEV
jgi:tight adherence protein B